MPVEADTGAMGGNGSHEFIAKADAGESEIAFCPSCKMAATVERAVCGKVKSSSEAELLMNKVYTPGTKTIESVCEYLNKPTDKSIKAIFLKVIPSPPRRPATPSRRPRGSCARARSSWSSPRAPSRATRCSGP